MRKPEAEKLVTDTFTNPYDETRFRNFASNLFQEYEALSEKASTGTYIPEAFRDGVVSFKRLAKFTDPEGLEVDVLAVKLASKRTLESARTMQRNFVARYLNGSRGGTLKDAALVAFYADDVDDWRFSLVRMDYVLDEEKQKVRKELTPARRYSFLVGHAEGTHTARRQWLPVLQTPDETTLAELETAFNIETVTKEFFEQYKALYLRLKEALDNHMAKDSVTKAEFEKKGVYTADFAKRLLGQIVFLYFLQKKGWLGVEKGQPWGTGPKDFMQRLYREGNYTNFFNDVLEHLFYDALATERQTQDHFYAPLNCKIPFLNGGLFEPFQGYAWDDTDILLDNKIFEDIFAVFDLYNFTVREDEPLDKEVAVDPEMLGKVFENLIPENERKGSGTFYTPREIVHYMCQESLINYLDTSLNVKSVPIEKKGQQALFGDSDKHVEYEDEYIEVVPRADIEAFIHHGDVAQENDATATQKHINEDYKGKYAFKVPETIRRHAPEIDGALANVKVCDPAIGSGAFPLGVLNEIVRARSSLNPYMGTDKRSAYDLKRHAIQSTIYGVDIEPSAVDIAKLRLWLSLVVDEDDFGSIKPLPNLDYKIVAGNSLLGFPFSTEGRSKKLRELTPLKDEYFNTYSPSRKAELQSKINEIIQSEYDDPLTEKSLGYKVNFDFRWSFFEVFDNARGFDVIIGNPPWGSKLSKDEKKVLKNLYPKIDSSTPNSFAYFLGASMEVSSGNIAVVLPDSILVKDFSKTRRLMKNNLHEIIWYQNIGLPEKLRPFLNVEHDVCVVMCSPIKTENCVIKTNYYDSGLADIVTKHSKQEKDDFIFSDYDFVFNLRLENIDHQILKKIESHSRLSDHFQCHEGIHTGNSRDKLFFDHKINDHCKPLYFGGSKGDIIDNYYSSMKGWHVDYRKDAINKDSGDYASLRDEKIFSNPKIYITRTGNPYKAFVDDHNYASNNFFSLQSLDYKKNTLEELKVVLPFVLSSVAQYFIRKFAAPRLGSTFVETKITHLMKFRIPELDAEDRSRLLKLVEDVIKLKGQDLPREATLIERKIDEMVLNSYMLSEIEKEHIIKFLGRQ